MYCLVLSDTCTCSEVDSTRSPTGNHTPLHYGSLLDVNLFCGMNER